MLLQNERQLYAPELKALFVSFPDYSVPAPEVFISAIRRFQ